MSRIEKKNGKKIISFFSTLLIDLWSSSSKDNQIQTIVVNCNIISFIKRKNTKKINIKLIRKGNQFFFFFFLTKVTIIIISLSSSWSILNWLRFSFVIIIMNRIECARKNNFFLYKSFGFFLVGHFFPMLCYSVVFGICDFIFSVNFVDLFFFCCSCCCYAFTRTIFSSTSISFSPCLLWIDKR